MLFGQSVFQSVVERLEREDESDVPEEEIRSGFGINSFSSSLVFETATQEPSSANRPLESYLGFVEQPVAQPTPEAIPDIMPPHLERTALSDVSDELAINDKDTVETLSEKRRNFARLNHPDMISPQFRHNANLRMTAANLLIDQAIRFISR
ncbi:hypothetical protein G6L37_18695 [Agrobacterium rubi]|uniref:hypothetical protein n=1 Tax=Agrobacterium rubi TaxID=28099 RepID=UPI0015738736|nr:hypothetical protein [Agrobacterium rubi]NTF08201.1 hypothetical protein [Agrobacterium rubi]NTF20429.1 hypothetical protein [Agrobacterium rubi]NTF27400.1 hypothetical protein [Agrobacterium rubi]